MKTIVVLCLVLLGLNVSAYETSLELKVSEQKAKTLIKDVNEALEGISEIKISAEKGDDKKTKFTISLEDRSPYIKDVVKSFDLSDDRIRVSNFGGRRPEVITLLNHLGFKVRGAQTASYSYYIHEILVPTAYLDM